MILMAYGNFRFSLQTFSYEQIERTLEARLEAVNIIGARPSLHRMGLGVEKISLKSTFFPWHLPGNRGLAQVEGLRAACGNSYSLVGNALGTGTNFGLWALQSVSETKSEIHPTGEGQKIEVKLDLMFDPAYGGGAGGLGSIFRIFG